MSAAKYGQYDYTMLANYVSELVAKVSGNRFGEKQRHMVESRLKKRMLDLGLDSPEVYLSYIKENQDKESHYLVSLLTTHHTFFFREFSHFEYLASTLPKLLEEVKKRGEKTLKVLTLACSKGHETYSLGMFLDHHIKEIDPTMDYKIIASDIDRESISYAQNGVYRYSEIKSIPLKYLGKHWARGKGDISDFAKIKDSIKSKCQFAVGNLMKLDVELKKEQYDVIFCRNVFIYFENEQIASITKVIMKHLYEHGLFFTGISESLNNLNLGLHTHGASIYSNKPQLKEVKEVAQHKTLPSRLKVLCVDDSGTVLTLLKKIFNAESGFEVVGTAKNGKEAEEFLRTNTVDVMTLDIHMPEMDGLTYLERNFSRRHPPVVVVSSASRDDSTHAMRALKLGASDFIEKPALNDIFERGEEIKMKLKVAFLSHLDNQFEMTSIDKEFSRIPQILDSDKKTFLIFAALADKKKILEFVSGLSKSYSSPSIILVSEGNYQVLPSMKETFQDEFRHLPVALLEKSEELESDHFYLADLKNDLFKIKSLLRDKLTTMLVIGKTSKKLNSEITSFHGNYLLVEDLGPESSDLKDIANDFVPVTSFAYLASEFFAKAK